MRFDLRAHALPLFGLIVIAIAICMLGGCAGHARSATAETQDIQTHSDAVFHEALAAEKKSHAKTAAERDAAETAAETARAARKAAEDKLAQDRAQHRIDLKQEDEQRALAQQAADQRSDHRWERASIVASCVLCVASLRFPAISGLLLSLAACTSAAAYGFAAASWMRGHVWLVPVIGVAVAVAALIHHLTGKDHQVRTGQAASAAGTTIARWMPNLAHIKAHWHLPPWLTAIGALFHRRTPTTPPAPAG